MNGVEDANNQHLRPTAPTSKVPLVGSSFCLPSTSLSADSVKKESEPETPPPATDPTTERTTARAGDQDLSNESDSDSSSDENLLLASLAPQASANQAAVRKKRRRQKNSILLEREKKRRERVASTKARTRKRHDQCKSDSESGSSPETSDDDRIFWVQCDSALCKKWHVVFESWNPKKTFKCSLIPNTTCESPCEACITGECNGAYKCVRQQKYVSSRFEARSNQAPSSQFKKKGKHSPGHQNNQKTKSFGRTEIATFIRNRFRDTLKTIFSGALSRSIEAALFRILGLEKKKYTAKCREIIQNLKNPKSSLVDHLKTQKITPDQLCKMTYEQMAPRELVLLRQKEEKLKVNARVVESLEERKRKRYLELGAVNKLEPLLVEPPLALDSTRERDEKTQQGGQHEVVILSKAPRAKKSPTLKKKKSSTADVIDLTSLETENALVDSSIGNLKKSNAQVESCLPVKVDAKKKITHALSGPSDFLPCIPRTRFKSFSVSLRGSGKADIFASTITIDSRDREITSLDEPEPDKDELESCLEMDAPSRKLSFYSAPELKIMFTRTKTKVRVPGRMKQVAGPEINLGALGLPPCPSMHGKIELGKLQQFLHAGDSSEASYTTCLFRFVPTCEHVREKNKSNEAREQFISFCKYYRDLQSAGVLDFRETHKMQLYLLPEEPGNSVSQGTEDVSSQKISSHSLPTLWIISLLFPEALARATAPTELAVDIADAIDAPSPPPSPTLDSPMSSPVHELPPIRAPSPSVLTDVFFEPQVVSKGSAGESLNSGFAETQHVTMQKERDPRRREDRSGFTKVESEATKPSTPSSVPNSGFLLPPEMGDKSIRLAVDALVSSPSFTRSGPSKTPFVKKHDSERNLSTESLLQSARNLVAQVANVSGVAHHKEPSISPVAHGSAVKTANRFSGQNLIGNPQSQSLQSLRESEGELEALLADPTLSDLYVEEGRGNGPGFQSHGGKWHAKNQNEGFSAYQKDKSTGSFLWQETRAGSERKNFSNRSNQGFDSRHDPRDRLFLERRREEQARERGREPRAKNYKNAQKNSARFRRSSSNRSPSNRY